MQKQFEKLATVVDRKEIMPMNVPDAQHSKEVAGAFIESVTLQTNFL